MLCEEGSGSCWVCDAVRVGALWMYCFNEVGHAVKI